MGIFDLRDYSSFMDTFDMPIVENIFIDGISMMDIKGDAITFNMFYGGNSVTQVYEDKYITGKVKTEVLPTPKIGTIYII